MSHSFDLLRRPRRNRQHAALRTLVQETRVTAEDLIAPVFVREGEQAPEEISSMPGVFRYSISGLVREATELQALGIRAMAVFPYSDPKIKNSQGTGALDPLGLIPRTVKALKAAVPEMVIIVDVALDPYTDHGHDGVLDTRGDVDNDATVEILQRMAVILAEAGADLVAPSDMMDGRVKAIRQALDARDLTRTGILAYSAKFSSAYYGPFREAVGSAQAAGTTQLDKRTYQLNPANSREAVLEARLDEEEGADILMVKPAGAYLDIIRAVRENSALPLAAYQVSGEYAQIQAAAKLGWLDLEKTRDESLLAIKRAGADMILTYFAKAVAKSLKG
ncbi:MAG: porphobilinogen synthase [Verrucomicrobiae bacterium]|nr:porphobilinogen synthase [Verrucomicrobiae bacterium]